LKIRGSAEARPEASKAENGGRVLGEGAACPCPPARGSGE